MKARLHVPRSFVVAVNQLVKPFAIAYGTLLVVTHLAGVATFFVLLRYVLPRPPTR